MAAILLLALMPIVAQRPAVDTATALHGERRAAITAERRDLTALADRLAEKGDGAGAEAVRNAIEPEPEPGTIRFVPLSEYVPAPKPGTTLGPALPEEAKAIRAKTTKTLTAIADRAASKTVRRLALADECLRGVIAREPSHAEARRLLGFLPYPKDGKGGWATPHAADLLSKGHILHPTFGWVLADWVPHLNLRELPTDFDANGKAKSWGTADEANALHADWVKPWQISTAPHFFVESDVPLDEAVAFAGRLEAFHDLFLAQFADVIGADRENLPLARRFDHKTQQPVASSKKFLVAYFATKTEYVGYLRSKFDLNEDVSLGYYMPSILARRANAKPRSYFYKDEQNAIESHATLYHEASHQLLFEMAGKTDYEKNRTNYWIWEGLGTYFETTTPQEDGSIVVGGLVGPRIEQARLQLIRDGNYVPIAKFVAMNSDEFRKNEDVYRNYAEAMALTVFLMHGEGGKYREPFLDYVAAAYRGKVKPASLAERLGVPTTTLDEQFKAFLK